MPQLMKVLITGCHGQVGTSLVRQLSGKADVMATNHKDLNISDSEAVSQIVQDFQPDVIINAAAHTAVDRAEEEIELSYQINCDGPRYLAEAAERVGAIILHISTDYVFAGDEDGNYSEQDQTDPQGVYGASKLAGEQAVAAACSRHIILRTAWVFGEYGQNFVKTMLRLAQNCDELSIVEDQFGGPTYAGDIAASLIEIAEQVYSGRSQAWGIYHYSGAPYVSWFQFAQAIFRIAVEQQLIQQTPTVNGLTTEEYPTPAKRPANSRMATRKIGQIFNLQPSDWQHELSSNLSAYLEIK